MNLIRFFHFMIGIYKITCLTNNRVYIGQSTNVLKRLSNYKNITNCKSQTRLFRSLNKYGVGNHFFEIICECDLEQLNDIERYWQEFYDVCGKNGLNCMLTKSSDRSGYSTQAGTKRKPRSEETKMKLRLANIGKKASDEAKAKMSAVHKGNKYNLGRRASDQVRAKMSETRKGKQYSLGHKHTDAAKLSMAESKLFRNIILDTSTGVYYYDFKSAADTIGLDNSYFMKIMKGLYNNRTPYKLV